MLSKNNYKLKLQKAAQKEHTFTLRKLSTGVASVMLGTLFVLNNANTVKADTTADKTTNQPTITNVETSSKNTTTTPAANAPQTGKDDSKTAASTAPVSTKPNQQTPKAAKVAQQDVKLVDDNANSNNVTLTHGDNGTREVSVSLSANAGDTVVIKVPSIFNATTDEKSSLYTTSITQSKATPDYVTNKSVSDTIFTYTINTSGSIDFNLKLTPTVSDWSFLPEGAIYDLLISQNGQDEGKIEYKIGQPATITSVDPNFDQNQASNNNLVKDQNYEVGIHLANDGASDGDNFAGTVTVDVPDGFVLSDAKYVGQGFVSNSTQVGDTDSKFNDLTNQWTITYSQAGAGAPVVINFNNAKSDLNGGNLLFWGKYTKDISAADNNFKASVSYYPTNKDGDKSKANPLTAQSKVFNVNLPVNETEKNSLDSKFVNNTGDIYTDNGKADGAHQQDNHQFDYGNGRSIQLDNNGNVAQTNVDVHVAIEPGTVFNNGTNTSMNISTAYALHIETPSINQTKSVILTLTNGKQVELPVYKTTAFNNEPIFNISDGIAEGVAPDGSNIKTLDIVFANIEPGTKLVIDFANNAILSSATDKKVGDIADYDLTVTSDPGINSKDSMKLPIKNPVNTQNAFTGQIEDFVNGSYQPTSINGGNQATITYTFRNSSNLDQPSSYLVAIPEGFDVDDVSQLHLYQNNQIYKDGTIKDLGYVGLNGEHMFEVDLKTTPSYQSPIYLKGIDNKPVTITVNPTELPGSYSYRNGSDNNQMSLIMAIDDNDEFSKNAPYDIEELTLKDGTKHKVVLSGTGWYPTYQEASYNFTYPSMYGAVNSVKSDNQPFYNGEYIPSKPAANITSLNYSDNNDVDNTTGSIQLSNVLTDGSTSNYSYNVINLPTVADGGSATLQLTGAGTIKDPNNTGSKLMYLLTPSAGVNHGSDLSNWLTADQVKDWSKVRAAMLMSNKLTSVNVVSAELPFKVTAMAQKDSTQFMLVTKFDGDHSGEEYSKDNNYMVNVDRYVDLTTNWVRNDGTVIKQATKSRVKSGDPYSTNKLAANEIPARYTLVKTTGDAAKGTAGIKNLKVTYVYGPSTTTEAAKKTVTETIHYVYSDGTKAADDHTATVTLTRTGKKDAVTGKTDWGDWTSDTFAPVVSPTIDGYTADLSQVNAQHVTADSKDIVVTVTYTKVVVPPVTPEPQPKLQPEPKHQLTPEPIPEPQPEPEKPVETKPVQPKATVYTAINVVPAKKTAVSNTTTVKPKTTAQELPQTGESNNKAFSILGMLSLALGLFGLTDRKRKN